MVGENEQRAMADTAKDYVDRTLRHIDLANLLPRRVVDKDLSVGHEHIAFAIDCDALAAALCKGLEIAQGAIGGHQRAMGAVFRFATDIDPLAGKGAGETVSVQIVGEAPASIVRRPLLEETPCRQE